MNMLKKVKRYKDKRVNVNYIRPIFWIVLLIVYDIMFVGFHLLVNKVWDSTISRGIVYAILGTYIFTSGALTVLAIWLIYNHFVHRHINTLKQAAQTVAAGDYTVRIPKHRKDDKKDGFQVLFDDFNAMTEALESTEMLKKDFISNISHELKTPLAAIQNFSTMLQSDGLAESDRKIFARSISESTARLTDLVTDILQLSSLEKKAIPVNKEQYNLSEQLNCCIIGFEHVWESKNIEITTDLDQSIYVYNDKHLLDIVWNNLLSNAFKFTPDGGTVDIKAKNTRSGYIVTITDNGCGMTHEQMCHIFDKFYQADISHSTKGNGLGLSLVKQIIELTDSAINVDSQPQKGSTFTVLLSH